jgi:hypothetical protein
MFSFRVTVIIDYAENTVVKIKYLFLGFNVVDTSKPPKEKKPKKKKEEPPEEEPVQEDKPKTKGNSLLKQIYTDHGYDGIIKMLNGIKTSLGGFFGRLYKTLVFDELYITMVTAGSDAADTAIKHGKLCAWAYPILGKLVSTSKVKKYDFDFCPDFLAQKSTANAYVRLHVTPIHITNAVVVLAVQLLFKVIIKILFSKNRSDKSQVIVADAASQEANSVENTNNLTNKNKDGASK